MESAPATVCFIPLFLLGFVSICSFLIVRIRASIEREKQQNEKIRQRLERKKQKQLEKQSAEKQPDFAPFEDPCIPRDEFEGPLPYLFYEVVENTLYGCGLPVTNEQLKKIEEEFNVGLLVTCLVEPLKAGRNINHLTKEVIAHMSKDGTYSEYDHNLLTEFHDCDADLFSGLSCETLHIPMKDGYSPSAYDLKRFLVKAKEVIDKGKSVCIHCWRGSGRSATLLACYLMYFYDYSAESAVQLIRTNNPNEKTLTSTNQLTFLKLFDTVKDIFMENDYPNDGITHETPKNCACYLHPPVIHIRRRSRRHFS